MPIVGTQADTTTFQPILADVGSDAGILIRRHPRQLPVRVLQELGCCSPSQAFHIASFQVSQQVAARRTIDVSIASQGQDQRKADFTCGPDLKKDTVSDVSLRFALLCCISRVV